MFSLVTLFGCDSTPRLMTTSGSAYSDTYDSIRKSLSPSDLKKFDSAIEILRIRPNKVLEGDQEMMQDLDGLDYQGTLKKAKSYAEENISSLSAEYENYLSKQKDLRNFKASCGQNISHLDQYNTFTFVNNTNRKVSKCKFTVETVNKSNGKVNQRCITDIEFESPLEPKETREMDGMLLIMNNTEVDTKIATIKFVVTELYDDKGIEFVSTQWSDQKLEYLKNLKSLIKNL